MHYQSPQIIKSKVGNNSLSYDQRMDRSGTAHIVIPSAVHIDTIDQIQLGGDVVLEEIDEQGVLHACMGLAHIYEYQQDGTPIIIMDNHNHALYYRAKYMSKHNLFSPDKGRCPKDGGVCSSDNADLTLRHIDQHSDLNSPRIPIDNTKRHDLEYLWRYTNFDCQISNFIKPFVRLYPNMDFTWVKSESQLLESRFESLESRFFILDIDLDFRAPEMSIAKYDETISITRQLIVSADLVTIASSPMFIHQHRALEILRDLLGT